MAKIAVLVGPEFEDSELRVPYDELKKAGHQVELLGDEAGKELVGKRGKEKVRADAAVTERDPKSYDALFIPGGHSPDNLRTDSDVVGFIQRFWETGKPVATICHGPQLLIEAEVVSGRRMTSWPSVRKDLENAGAEWVDEQVVEDRQLISSRNPGDLEAFSRALVRRLEKRGEQEARA